MEYIYAAMLLHKAGKEISEAAVKSVLTAAGVSVDAARVKALVAALEGVNIEEAIKKASIAAPVAMAAAPAESKADEKKEDKKKHEEDQKKADDSAAAGLGALFG
ncbi:MAG TPA: 50S ribosomal protein P1 [Candidatus Nanoarchaeia archaeon]|nr:50S ribosomal protein P1 [Candidatus Nanoarchaeia archaeon]